MSEPPLRCVFCHDDIPSVLNEAHRYLKSERHAHRKAARDR